MKQAQITFQHNMLDQYLPSSSSPGCGEQATEEVPVDKLSDGHSAIKPCILGYQTRKQRCTGPCSKASHLSLVDCSAQSERRVVSMHSDRQVVEELLGG